MHADERRYTQGFEWIALEPYPRLSALICGSILNTNSNNGGCISKVESHSRVTVREAGGKRTDERWAGRKAVGSCGESEDAGPLWGSCKSDMSVGSARGTDESVKMALDMACGTATLAVEG